MTVTAGSLAGGDAGEATCPGALGSIVAGREPTAATGWAAIVRSVGEKLPHNTLAVTAAAAAAEGSRGYAGMGSRGMMRRFSSRSFSSSSASTSAGATGEKEGAVGETSAPHLTPVKAPPRRLPETERIIGMPLPPWTPSRDLDKTKALTKRAGYMMRVLDAEQQVNSPNFDRFPQFSAGDVLEVELVRHQRAPQAP